MKNYGNDQVLIEGEISLMKVFTAWRLQSRPMGCMYEAMMNMGRAKEKIEKIFFLLCQIEVWKC